MDGEETSVSGLGMLGKVHTICFSVIYLLIC